MDDLGEIYDKEVFVKIGNVTNKGWKLLQGNGYVYAFKRILKRFRFSGYRIDWYSSTIIKCISNSDWEKCRQGVRSAIVFWHSNDSFLEYAMKKRE